MRFIYVIVNFDTRSIRVSENSREAYLASTSGFGVLGIPAPDTAFTEPQPTGGTPPPKGGKPHLVMDKEQIVKELNEPRKLDWTK